MKWKSKNKYRWQRWFAWRPIYIVSCEKEPRDFLIAPKGDFKDNWRDYIPLKRYEELCLGNKIGMWFWFEWIERKYITYKSESWYSYRLLKGKSKC